MEPIKTPIAYTTHNDGKIEVVVGHGDHTCTRYEITEQTARTLYLDLHKIVTAPWFRLDAESAHIKWWLTEGRGR